MTAGPWQPKIMVCVAELIDRPFPCVIFYACFFMKCIWGKEQLNDTGTNDVSPVRNSEERFMYTGPGFHRIVTTGWGLWAVDTPLE